MVLILVCFTKQQEMETSHLSVSDNCSLSPSSDLQYTLTHDAELLIARGEDLNKLNRQGEAPIHLASRYGHVNIIKALLESGVEKVNIDIKTRLGGDTALHIAAESGNMIIAKVYISTHVFSFFYAPSIANPYSAPGQIQRRP